MKVAVIGGGINGIMTAWKLQKEGYQVIFYEKDTLLSQTSFASSKLPHGGLRYLENHEFRLVKEALREREWWLSQAPHLAKPLKLIIPIYRNNKRSSSIYKLGLWLYDFLAGKYNFGIHQSYCKAEIQQQCPELKIARLKSGFSFYDGRIDDYQLGVWVAEQASKVGVTLIENTPIKKLTMTGKLATDTETALYDYVVSATGPWAQKLLQISNIRSKYQLNLARGTRLVIDRVLTHGFLLEIPDEQRIFFVLPYQGQMLIGTTEVRQVLNEKIKMSTEEISYLIDAYDYYFKEPISQNDIVKSFAGLRPLIRSSTDPNRATREYYIEKSNKLVTVFGGKWTTARQLASSVAREICD